MKYKGIVVNVKHKHCFYFTNEISKSLKVKIYLQSIREMSGGI